MSLSPTDALRTIRAVLADRRLTFGERVAVAAVVLSADNQTGEAWASYRSLQAEFGLAPATVAGVLTELGEAQTGRAAHYLTRAGKGRKGSNRFIVRSASASVNEAQAVASASDSEALQSGQRFNSRASALHSSKQSASKTEDKLAPETNPTKLAAAAEVREGEPANGETAPDAQGEPPLEYLELIERKIAELAALGRPVRSPAAFRAAGVAKWRAGEPWEPSPAAQQAEAAARARDAAAERTEQDRRARLVSALRFCREKYPELVADLERQGLESWQVAERVEAHHREQQQAAARKARAEQAARREAPAPDAGPMDPTILKRIEALNEKRGSNGALHPNSA